MTTFKERSHAARMLALGMPKADYICEECGKGFVAIRKTGYSTPKYCGTACRSLAYRKRKYSN